MSRLVASPPALHLPAELAARVLAHARAELPNEACGLIGGDPVAGRARSFHAGRNRHASPLRYDLHPEDLVRIVFAIESAGEALLAVFHSHTRSPAVPSATDLREARYDALQLIATLSDPAVGDPRKALRAWRVSGASATEMAIEISA